MPDPGDVVTVDFAGAVGIKRRPAVIVSSSLYHAHRRDVIVGVITSQIAAAATPLDYVLQDWQRQVCAGHLHSGRILERRWRPTCEGSDASRR